MSCCDARSANVSRGVARPERAWRDDAEPRPFRACHPTWCVLMATTIAIAVPISAAEPIRLTTDGRVKRDPVFLNRQGTELLYVVLERPTQLRLMKLNFADGSSSPLHPNETRSEFEPDVSRDGRFIAFVQNRGNLSLALVIRDLTENKQWEVPPGGGFSGFHSPAFTPDMTRVWYSYPDKQRQPLNSVTPQATDLKAMVESEGVNNWPSFSLDGRHVAFSSTRDGNFDLYVMKIDGTELRRLTDNPRQDLRPKFSPDGSRIAFVSNRDGNYEIYVMNRDGGGTVRVTDHEEQDNYPTWHPDGRRLVIVSERQGHHDLYLVPVP